MNAKIGGRYLVSKTGQCVSYGPEVIDEYRVMGISPTGKFVRVLVNSEESRWIPFYFIERNCAEELEVLS